MSRWRPPSEASTALITQEGRERLRAELQDLWQVRRPEVVKALAAAAAEGDRSENAEYIYRKKQLGHELMRLCVAQIHSHFGEQKIVLSAQAHLQDFYKKHNFVPEGATYLEDGIPHIHMIKL